jgi:hypothetical protein
LSFCLIASKFEYTPVVKIVEFAQTHGVNILFVLTKTPEFCDGGPGHNHLPGEHVEQWRQTSHLDKVWRTPLRAYKAALRPTPLSRLRLCFRVYTCIEAESPSIHQELFAGSPIPHQDHFHLIEYSFFYLQGIQNMPLLPFSLFLEFPLGEFQLDFLKKFSINLL